MKAYPVNSKVKFHFVDAVEILRVVEHNGDKNKCQFCRFGKVVGRHCMTGRIEEWGCRMNNIETGCGSIGNDRFDCKSVFYIKIK